MGDSGDLLLFSFSTASAEQLAQVRDRLAGGRRTTLLAVPREPYMSLGSALAELWKVPVMVNSLTSGTGLRDSLVSQTAFSKYSAVVQETRDLVTEGLDGGFKVVLAPVETIGAVLQALGLQQSYPAALLAMEAGRSARIVKVFLTPGEFSGFLLGGSLRESCKDFFQPPNLHFEGNCNSLSNTSPLQLGLKFDANRTKNAIRAFQPDIEAAFHTHFSGLPKDMDRRQQCEDLRHQLLMAIESDFANQVRTWLGDLDTRTQQIGYLRGDMEAMGRELKAAGCKVSPLVGNLLARANALTAAANETQRHAETALRYQHCQLIDQRTTLSGLLSTCQKAPLARIEEVKTMGDLTVVVVVHFRKPYHIPCNLVVLSGAAERTLPIEYTGETVREMQIGSLAVLQEGELRVVIRGEDGQSISQEFPLMVREDSIRKVVSKPVDGYLNSLVYQTVGNVEEIEEAMRTAGGETALLAFRDLAAKWQNSQGADIPDFVQIAIGSAGQGLEAMRGALAAKGHLFSL